MTVFRIVALGVHGFLSLTSGRRIGRLLSHLNDLGGAYLGASGQSNKTSDETRCVKIVWHSGILCIHSFVKLCLQRACIGTLKLWMLVDGVCAEFLDTFSFTNVSIALLITLPKHKPFNLKLSTLIWKHTGLILVLFLLTKR